MVHFSSVYVFGHGTHSLTLEGEGLFGCNTVGFLLEGGVVGHRTQSVSVVDLIKAGGRRWSNREQVPLTAETHTHRI